MAILTADQVTQLKTLIDAANEAMSADASQVGIWAPVYQQLARDLTTYTASGDQIFGSPNPGVSTAPWLWITGASGPNGDQGAFGNLITAYTAEQYQLRYGTAPPAGLIATASNGIGRAFFADVLNNVDPNTGELTTLPDISTIGTDDAGSVAAGIFGNDYAPWAGTFLFADLGDNEFFQKSVLTLNPNPPFTNEYGTYNLVSVAAALQGLSINWGQALASFFNGEFANIGFWTNVLSADTLPPLISQTNTFFAQTYGLTNSDFNYKIGNDIFSWLAPFSFLSSATYQVGLLNQPTTLTVLNTGQPHVVVLNGTGGTIIDNAATGIIDGGMNSSAKTTVDYTSLNGQESLQLEGQGAFGWRIENDKKSTVSDGQGGQITTTNVEYLFNVNNILLGSGDDTLTLTDASLNLPVPPLTIDFGGNKTDPAKGTGSGDVVDASAVTKNLSVTLNRDTWTLNGPGSLGLLNLKNVETIKLGSGANSVVVDAIPSSGVDAPSTPSSGPSDPRVDLGATATDSGDVVDFSQYQGNVYLSSAKAAGGAPNAIEVYGNINFTNDLNLGFTNFNTLKLGDGNNNVRLNSADDPYLTTVQIGNGDNVIRSSNVVNLHIDLGTGTNIVGHVARGTIINVQSQGNDTFVQSDDEKIIGSTNEDRIFSPGGILLKGAVGHVGTDDPWIVGPDGTRYGLNQQGELVIKDLNNDQTFIDGYQGGPNVPFADQTDGIFVGLSQAGAEKLLDLKRPFNSYIGDIFKLGNAILFTKTGETFFHVDPLVFDLTGGGVNLAALSSASPMLDMQGTGFAINTGWVEPNDGILVLEQPGQDGTPTLTEMFGNTSDGQSGFAALAQYDANSDGVIDANDPVYAQLSMWVDTSDDGQVDSGEPATLQRDGIASIILAQFADTRPDRRQRHCDTRLRSVTGFARCA